MDSNKVQIFTSAMTDDDATGTVEKWPVFEFVKVKEEIQHDESTDETMIEMNRFMFENKDDSLNAVDPLDVSNKDVIKTEKVEVEINEELVIQEGDIKKEIAECGCSWDNDLNASSEIKVQPNEQNYGKNCMSVSDSLSKEWVVGVNSSFKVDELVLGNSIASDKVETEVAVESSGRNAVIQNIETQFGSPVKLPEEDVIKDKFSLDMCEKSFNSLGSLSEPKPKHAVETLFVCDLCDKSFTQLSSLNRHKQEHSRAKPFVCDVCKKSFARVDYLTNHRRTHTGDKPFVCNVCNKPFANLSNLNKHKLTHSEIKQFMCDVCEKLFARQSYLNEHMRNHTGDRPFVCNVCKKSYIRATHLKVHKQLHTGEKPFVCDVCEKSFTYSSNLIVHKRQHVGGKPFACDVCEKSFTQSSALKRHRWLQHIR